MIEASVGSPAATPRVNGVEASSGPGTAEVVVAGMVVGGVVDGVLEVGADELAGVAVVEAGADDVSDEQATVTDPAMSPVRNVRRFMKGRLGG